MVTKVINTTNLNAAKTAAQMQLEADMAYWEIATEPTLATSEAKYAVSEPQYASDPDSSWRRMELIQMLIPTAVAAGATSVENIINTAAKLEKYIITGVNPLEQPIIGHTAEDGPIVSEPFEADVGEQYIVDGNGVLQVNPEYVPF